MANIPRFNLKSKVEPSTPTLISLHFRVNTKRIVLSTGMTVQPKFWNDKKMRVKETAGNFNAKSINDHLNRIDGAARDVERNFRTNGKYPSIKQFKEAILLKLTGSDKRAAGSFNAFIEAFIKERSHLPSFSKSTIQVYKTAQNHYTRFVKGQIIEFPDVTLDHLADFVRFLRRKSLGDNTVHKMISTLQTMFSDAAKKGIHQSPKFSISDLMVSRQESDNVYLTMEELQKLEDQDLSGQDRLGRVRDLLLLGSFTGLRFSDFSKIDYSNIRIIKDNGQNKEILSVTTQKTKEKVDIPVHPKVKQILLRYEGKAPKGITSQKLNEYLKELCQSVDIKETFEVRKYPGGKLTITKSPKWELVSSHTARRSFATNAYKSGMDPLAIMKITGHKSYTVFMKYIRMDKEENAVRMADHPFFKQ